MFFLLFKSYDGLFWRKKQVCSREQIFLEKLYVMYFDHIKVSSKFLKNPSWEMFSIANFMTLTQIFFIVKVEL